MKQDSEQEANEQMTTVNGQRTTDIGQDGRAVSMVQALRSTFASGRTRSLGWRAAQLEGIERLLTEREADFATALAADLGRTAHESWFGDIAPVLGEVRYALRHLKRWTRPRRVPLPAALLPGKAWYRYEPLGVTLIIGPWNYPVHLCLAPLVGALSAGNCAALKPSEHAPSCSATLADLLPRYLDHQAVKVIEGGPEVIQNLIGAGVDHVFFTGGTETGRKVMQAAAAQLVPVTLELGGKSPAIVTRHANLDVAARRIAFGKLINSGQTCVAPDYVLVDHAVKEDLVERLAENLLQMRQGEPPTQPIVNERHSRRLRSLVETAGGTVVLGGGASARAMEPTIVVDPDPGSDLMTTEIFGPVLPVIGVASLDEAITFVNARDKPLVAYVFSDRRSDCERVCQEVPAGAVTANHTLMHVMAPQLPFGGVGSSGIGAYHGRWGFECFSHPKPVLMMPSRPDLRFVYPPYSERAKRLLRLALTADLPRRPLPRRDLPRRDPDRQ